MTKRKINPSPPFRLPGQIKHSHQAYFLYFINELAPEVSEEIKKLHPLCEEFFGSYPFSTPAIQDYRGLGVWYSNPYYDEKQRPKWFEFITIFRECIWFETRNYIGITEWLKALEPNDEILKAASEIQRDYSEKVQKFIDNHYKENVEFYKSFYLKLPEYKNLSDYDLEFNIKQYLRMRCYEWLKENNENYLKTWKIQWDKIDNFEDFLNRFDGLIERFCLEKHWLAQSLFLAIWNGSGKLQTASSYMESVPEEILDEIKERLGRNEPNQKENTSALRPLNTIYDPNIPLPDSFNYKEIYRISTPFEYYEESAIEAYRQHLQDYFRIIKESFKKFGYKELQGDTYNYERLKWLVWWNVKKWDKTKIVEENERETREDKEIGKEIEISTINKAFNQFKSYDLPVRTASRREK
jgi:hypothetical protein